MRLVSLGKRGKNDFFDENNKKFGFNTKSFESHVFKTWCWFSMVVKEPAFASDSLSCLIF